VTRAAIVSKQNAEFEELGLAPESSRRSATSATSHRPIRAGDPDAARRVRRDRTGPDGGVARRAAFGATDAQYVDPETKRCKGSCSRRRGSSAIPGDEALRTYGQTEGESCRAVLGGSPIRPKQAQHARRRYVVVGPWAGSRT